MIYKKALFISLVAIFVGYCGKEKTPDQKNEKPETESVQLTGETLFVAAKSGLNIRSEAKAGTKVVVLAPFGSGVQVVKDDKPAVAMTSEGFKGHWKLVQYDGKTGYAFDGFLIGHPVPANGEDFKKYIYRVYGPKQGEKIHAAKKDITVDEKSSFKEEFFLKDGARHIETGYYAGSTDLYILPETTVQEAFLMAKLAGVSMIKNMGLPQKNHTITDEKEPMNSYKVEVKKAGGQITQISADQEYFGVTIKATKKGVEVSIGGGT